MITSHNTALKVEVFFKRLILSNKEVIFLNNNMKKERMKREYNRKSIKEKRCYSHRQCCCFW